MHAKVSNHQSPSAHSGVEWWSVGGAPSTVGGRLTGSQADRLACVARGLGRASCLVALALLSHKVSSTARTLYICPQLQQRWTTACPSTCSSCPPCLRAPHSAGVGILHPPRPRPSPAEPRHNCATSSSCDLLHLIPPSAPILAPGRLMRERDVERERERSRERGYPVAGCPRGPCR